MKASRRAAFSTHGMTASHQYSCAVRVAWRLARPSSIHLLAEQRSGCLGCWIKTFVPVVSIRAPPEHWTMLPGRHWENTEAEIVADFGKLGAMDGDGRVKVKVKDG